MVPNDEAEIKKKEDSIMELGNMLAKNKQTQGGFSCWVIFFLEVYIDIFP